MTITADDLLAMGFSSAMFGITDAELTSRITAVISEQTDLITDRVGAAVFALAANAHARDRAVKLLTAAELARRRILQLSANTRIDAAESSEADGLEKNITAWEKQADVWIKKMLDGAVADSGGFASGCTTSYSDARMTYPDSEVTGNA
jgi:hypothetical protein